MAILYSDRHFIRGPSLLSPSPPLHHHHLISSPSNQQMPSTSTNHSARNIPILHQIQITLGNIYDLPNLADGDFLLHLRKHSPFHILGHILPQFRIHHSRRHEIDSQGFQIECHAPHHALQTGRVGVDDGPVGKRSFGHGTCRDDDAGCGAGVHVFGGEFAEEEGREEADHALILENY